jgi:hypothetical protein
MKPVKRSRPFPKFKRQLQRMSRNPLAKEFRMTTDEILRVFERAKPVEAISEYQREQLAIRSNFERLKAERLAREAAASK